MATTIGFSGRGAILSLAVACGALPALAGPATVAVSVRYPARGPALTLTSDPETVFACARGRAVVLCTTHVPRGTRLALRARTRAPAGSASASALSLPIDGKAWGGACAGTAADVCRLRATHALAVRIDPHAA